MSRKMLAPSFAVCLVTLANVTAFVVPILAQENVIDILPELQPITPENASGISEVGAIAAADTVPADQLAIDEDYAANELWMFSSMLASTGAQPNASNYHVAVNSSGMFVVGTPPRMMFFPNFSFLETSTQPDFTEITPTVENTQAVALSPDGTILAIAAPGVISLWDIVADAELASFSGPPGNVHDMAFSPDGSLLAVAGGEADQTAEENGIRLIAVETLSNLNPLIGHTSDVLALTFSNDGLQLASVGRDKTVYLWRIPDGDRQRMWEQDTDILSLAFSPDQRVLASGTADGKIVFRDVSTGVELQSLEAHDGAVYYVNFSPDGLLLLSTGADTIYKFWGTSVDNGELPPLGAPAASGTVGPQPLTSEPTTVLELTRAAVRATSQAVAELPAATQTSVPTGDMIGVPACSNPDFLATVRSSVGENDKFLERETVENGFIVFVSNRTGTSELYVMDAFGDSVQQFTRNSMPVRQPAWSPDGTQIAFTFDIGGPPGLYVMNANGDNPRNLTAFAGMTGDAAWSRDGTRIAFSADGVPGNFDIFVLDLSDSSIHRLTEDPQSDSGPTWSADGQWIAFTSLRSGNPEIYKMQVDGMNLCRLTNESAPDFLPSWSPDGTRIAFSSRRAGDTEIFITDVDGIDVRQVTENDTDDFDVEWSPDGGYLVFTSHGLDGTNDVVVIDVDGHNARNLTQDGVSFEPSWQPVRSHR